MNERQRFIASMHFDPVDRPFRWETLGMWPETLDRWYTEGLDARLKQPCAGDMGAIVHDEYERVLVYGFDMDRIDYLRNSVISGYTDTPYCPAFAREILEDNGSARIIRDTDGIVKREFVHYAMSSMPQFLNYPVSSRDDWLALLPRLDPDTPERFSSDWMQVSAFYENRTFPVGLTL